jgi:hypothetical protein
MKEPRYRTIRMAIKLANEMRVTQLEIQADSIPDSWELQPNGTYAHAALRALAYAWALDALEIRAYTCDKAEPHFFHLSEPADNAEQAVRKAAERTWTPKLSKKPSENCDRCGGPIDEPSAWQTDPDAWKRRK